MIEVDNSCLTNRKISIKKLYTCRYNHVLLHGFVRIKSPDYNLHNPCFNKGTTQSIYKRHAIYTIILFYTLCDSLSNTFQNPFDRGLLKITHFSLCYSFLVLSLISRLL